MNHMEMTKRKAIGYSLIAIVMMVVAQVAAQVVASLLVAVGAPIYLCNILAGILYLAGTLLIAKAVYGKLAHLDLSEFGIRRLSFKMRWVLIAFALPLAVSAAYLCFVPGELVSSEASGKDILDILSAGIFWTGIGAGFVEEIVFRGVILHCLKKAWNTGIAVLLPSVLFGFLHILGQNFSLGSSLLVLLAGTAVGVMFSMITLESGSVWCSGLVHAMWNAIIIGGGLTIAEQASSNSIMTYVLDTKAFILTGGQFGIESSLLSCIGYLAVALLALAMIRKQQ